MNPAAPQLFEDVPQNLALDFHLVIQTVNSAFKNAHHISKASIRNNRVVVACMEPRSALVEFEEKAGRYTVHMGCRHFRHAKTTCALLNVEPAKVRVLTKNVGGSFGMKSFAYPEYICLLHAAKMLGRPIKWTDERSSSFLSDQQGRDHDVEGELALDKDGNFLAVRLSLFSNMEGTWQPSAPIWQPTNG